MSRLVASGAALIAVSYGLARFGLGAFVPELRATFELSGTGIGLVMGASFSGYVIALAVAGRLLRTWGSRRVVLASGLTATAGLLGIAVATHPVLLATAVEDQLVGPKRAGAQTIINAGTSLGLMLAAPVAVAVGVAWRQAFLVFGILAAVATVAAARAVAPVDEDQVAAAPVVTPASTASSRPWYRPPLPPRLVATAVLLGVSTALFWSFGRELIVGTTAATDAVARLSWLVLGAGGLLGGLAGRTANRVGLPVTVAIGWTGLVTAYLVFGIGQAPVAVAAVGVAAFGAGYMALTGLVIVWSVRARPEEPGSAVAVGFLLLALGQTAASPVVGVMVDVFGLATASLASAVLALAGLAALVPIRTPARLAPVPQGSS